MFFCSSLELVWTRLGYYGKTIFIFILDSEKNKCVFTARLRSFGLVWALLDSLGLLWENYFNFRLRLWKKQVCFFSSLELMWARLSSYGLIWALMDSLGLLWENDLIFILDSEEKNQLCFCSLLELMWARLSSYGLTWALMGSLGLLCKILIDFHLKSC